MIYNSLFSLENKVILISGASSGIGKGIAIASAKAGATIIGIGRNQNKLNVLSQELKHISNKKHCVISCDITNYSELPGMISHVVAQCGKINGFVHSAGIANNCPLKISDESVYKRTFDTNTISAFEISRLISLKKNCGEKASFVFVASVSALKGEPGLIAYSASKGALISGCRSMAAELVGKKIRVNCVVPGQITDTEIGKYQAETLDSESYQKLADSHPLGLGKVENLVGPILFLLSEAASWITGSALVVDGGYTL